MSDPRDLARYLPLSNRPRVDESGVTSDWRAKLSELTGEPVDRTVRIGELGKALLAAYEAGLMDADPVTSGAVALARAAAAPLPIRAVIRDRTLRATDAGWEFGSGPELAGTARELVLFLYGRGPVPRP